MRCWVFSFCLFLVFINCSLDEPKAPSWNTTLNFPVTEKKYMMSELVNENGNLINYDDGLVGFRIEGNLDKTMVGDNFALTDIEESFNLKTSEVVIPKITVGELTFAPAQFIADAEDTYNQSRPVARLPVSDVGGPVQTESGPVSATISSGTLRLNFDNSLPVAIEITEIKLEEFGAGGAVKLRHTNPLTISANSKNSLDIDLANIMISTEDRWSVSGFCAGSNGQDVIVHPDDSFDINIDLLDVTTESLTAPAEYFSVEQQDSVVIGEAVCIRKASFSAGDLTFDIRNRLAFDLNISINSPQFLNKITRVPLKVEIVAARGRTTTKRIPIEDFSIEYEGLLQKPQTVDLFVNVQGEDDSGQISMRGDDAVELTFGMRGVVIDKFTGRLDQFDVGIKPVEQRVTLPDNMDGIRGLYLEDARMTIDFFNTLEMPVLLKGALVGKSNDGKEQALNIDAEIEAGTSTAESATQVTYVSSENKDVARLASLLPETIKFDGHAYVGNGVAEGSLSSESYIRAQYFIETPAFFSWNESDFVPDTTYFQVNPDGYKGPKIHPDAIELEAKDLDLMEEFSVIADIENHLPVSGAIEFTLSEDTSPATEHELSLKPVTIQTAKLDDLGLVTRSWEDSLVVKLSKEDVDIFRNDGEKPKIIKLITTMKMHSTDGKKVKVFDTDYLIIQAAARLVVGINKD